MKDPFDSRVKELVSANHELSPAPPHLDETRLHRRPKPRSRHVATSVLLATALVSITVLYFSRGDRPSAEATSPSSADRTTGSEVAAVPTEGQSVVSTGTEVIVWGGELGLDGHPLQAGAVFDGALGVWESLPDGPLSARAGHVAVWAGTEMIVLGGPDEAAAAFDPAHKSWRTLPGAPAVVGHHAAGVWTGREVLAWGGTDESGAALSVGVALDPEAGTWRVLPPAPLANRAHATAVWTGSEMIVYGGQVPDTNEGLTDGAAYSPDSDSWRPLPASPIPPLYRHVSVFGAGEMLVIGQVQGSVGTAVAAAAYDPSVSQWRSLPNPNLPFAPPNEMNAGTSGLWTGTELVLWPGYLTGDQAELVAYRPSSNAWRNLGPAPGPNRHFPALGLVGDRLILEGGGSSEAVVAALPPFR